MQELLKKYKTIYINRNIRIATIIAFVELMLFVVSMILFHMLNSNNVSSEYHDTVGAGIAAIIFTMVIFLVGMISMNPAVSPDDIEDLIQKLSNGDIPAVKVQGSPQTFNFERKLVVGCAPNGGLVGFVKMTHVRMVGIMTSIYGGRGPSSVSCLESKTGVLVGLTKQQWENMPTPDEAQLPYLKVEMFPKLTYLRWCYLVPDAMGKDTATDVFGNICREILLDIVEKRLQKSVLMGIVIKPANDNPYTNKETSFPFIEEDFIPYFQKRQSEGKGGIYSDISDAEEMIQPLLKKQEKKISGHINYSTK